MKIKIYVVILNVLLTHITFSQITGNDNTWEIVFNDNFTIFEPTYWLNCYSWSHINGGDEYNDPLNVTTSNGYLIITAEELNENTKIPYQGRDYYYKSGAINSNTNVKYKYGYFEISAIFPVGYGYWPAFWLLTYG
jgi:beta-glucanase (GH16 family)